MFDKLKLTFIGATALVMSGCSGIPSFYDDNESLAVIDVVVATERLQCDSPFVKQQIDRINSKTHWLTTYSTLKGSDDVVGLLEPFQKSLNGLSKKQVVNVKYCEMKKPSLVKQSKTIAGAVLGRF
jgi:hypothetical protein